MKTRAMQAAATVAVGAVIAFNLTSGSSSEAASLPSLGVPEHDVVEIDDGLEHYVVHAPGISVAPSEEAVDQPTSSRHLVLDEDGQPIIVSVGETTEASSPEPTSSSQLDDVGDLTLIGPDLYAVATTLTAEELEAVPGVDRVAPDIGMTTLAQDSSPAPTGSYELLQWALENTGQKMSGPAGTPDADIDAPAAWEHSTGDGVVVAVIDTGVDSDHPDIADNLWTNTGEDDCTDGLDDDNNGFVDDCHGWDFAHDDNSIDDTDTSDRHDHGTHISGVIAAPRDSVGTTGVAPDAQIMVLKVIESQTFWMSDSVRAIDYAVTNGADVINISWGSTPSTAQADVEDLQAAIDRAEAAGVVIVAAAGNQSVDIDTKPVQPASLPNPGLITVAASTNLDEKASFSAFGPGTVDIFAPGQNVAGPVTDDWAFMGGSSVAAAHVSGAAALVLERWPEMSPAGVRQLLVDTADLIPALEGLAKQPARLNVGNIFAEGGPSARLLFEGFDNVEAGTSAPLAVGVIRQDAGSALSVRATLMIQLEGQVHAVLNHPAVVQGIPGSTDSSGQLTLGEVEATETMASAEISTALPPGEFALIVELIDQAGGLAQPAEAVFFSVAEPVEPTDVDTADDGPPVDPDDGGVDPDDEARDDGESSDTGSDDSVPDPIPVADPAAPTAEPPDETPADEPDGEDEEAAATETEEAGDEPDGDEAGEDPPAEEPETEDEAESDDSAESDEPQNSPPSESDPDATPTAAVEPQPDDSVEPETTEPGAPDDATMSISSLVPARGPDSGGTVVVINGAGFTDRSTVSFGSAVGNRPISISETQIIVKTRSHPAGLVEVSVSSPAGDIGSLSDAFLFESESSAVGEDSGSTPDVVEGDDDPKTNRRPETPNPGATQPSGQKPVSPGNKPVATGDFTGEGNESVANADSPLVLSLGPSLAWQDLTVAPLQGPSQLMEALTSGWSDQPCVIPSCSGVALS